MSYERVFEMAAYASEAQSYFEWLQTQENFAAMYLAFLTRSIHNTT